VVLKNQHGKELASAAHLADGVEVEVTAATDVAGEKYYRVRTRSDDADGWLSAVNLRAAAPPTELPAAEACPDADPSEIRFGRRPYTQLPPPSAVPTTVERVRGSDDDRRGFGQAFDPVRKPAVEESPKRPFAGDAGGRRRFGRHS